MARPPAPAASSAPPPPVDPLVWLACAAPLSRIPVVGSQVYYFPEGHAEQCPAPLPEPLPPTHQVFLCAVAAVRLAADATTGEPFATISLVPAVNLAADATVSLLLPAVHLPTQGDQFRYYAKQLTQSDANNGGGFSIPRSCAEKIFPALNLTDDPPVQNLAMTDLQGQPWKFRHIYRGTPRRHLLTTGWSRFVNAKLLVAGDTVVFMRRPDASLLIGVRRAARYTAGVSPCNARARVPPQEVMDSARLAAEGAPFTVTYYPRQGAGEFVVPRAEVEKGLTATDELRAGVQVRAQVVETEEDPRRVSWLNGTVKNVSHRIWRNLQVEWDPSSSSFPMENRYVNPWQIQPVGFPPLPMGLQIQNSSTAPMPLPLELLPAGIQGAWHHANAHADIPSSSMLTTQPLFPRADLHISVPPTFAAGSSHSGSSNNSENTPEGMKTIQLFGVTITSPVAPMQCDTDDTSAYASASAQVNQVPQGMDYETASEGTSATSPLDSLSNGQNHDGARL
uniref:TF-B3 domain-containing protein n=1 Tax=Leersia perrieri TaxID=77586 RepID=A0A0D9WBJ0_9ORYZ